MAYQRIRVILGLEVKELRSLYVHVYTFLFLHVSSEDFFHTVSLDKKFF